MHPFSAGSAAPNRLSKSSDGLGLTLPIIPAGPIAWGRYGHQQVSVQSVGGFLMGYGRGGTAPSWERWLWLVVLTGLWTRTGLAQEADGLSLQLVSGQKNPGQELKVDTLHAGSSQKKTKDETTRILPLSDLNEASQRIANAVLQNTSLYRRLPTIRSQVDHRVYRFFADHPDVAVSLWRAMGVSKLEMHQTGEWEYEADAKDGTVGVITILRRTPTDCLIHCSGMFQSPVLTKPIQAKAILYVRTSFEVDSSGQQQVTHTADMFVAFPSQTVETVAKAMAPISNKITDKNFEEVSLFLRMMQLAMTQQPGWVEQIAGKLEGVMPGRSEALLEVTAQSYIDEKRRLGEIAGAPMTLDQVRPPVAVAPMVTLPR